MNPRSDGDCVVVGVDGSTTSFVALAWATREAAVRRLALLIVHVDPCLTGIEHQVSPLTHTELRTAEGPLVGEAAAYVRSLGRVPRRMSTLTLTGDPPNVLGSVAEGARMLVVGTRGLSSCFGLPLGRTAHGVAERAWVPTVIVPTAGVSAKPTDRPVVLALDPTTGENAVDFAFDQAAFGSGRLHAVHVRQSPADPREVVASVASRRDRHRSAEYERGREESHRTLAERLSRWSEKYPAVRVEQLVLDGPASVMLSRETRGAALAVVGGRRGPAVSSALHSPVTRDLLEHTSCPIAVVHDEDSSWEAR